MKTQNRDILPFKDKVIWASCDGMGTLLAYNVFSSFLTYYFTDVCGLAITLVGNLILISRVADTFTDFMIGVAIDRVNFKSGKYRGWLKIGIIPMAVNLPLIFFPLEGASMTTKIVWQIIFYATYGCIWNTIVFTPSHAQLMNMTSNAEERSSAIGIREVFYNIGVFLIASTFLPMVKLFGHGNESWGFFFASIVVGLIVFVSIGANILMQKKYELNPDGSSRGSIAPMAKAEKGSLLHELVMVVKNRPAVVLLVTILLTNILMVIKGSLLVYSFKYYFGMEDFYAVAMGAFTITAIVGALLIKYFVRWFKDSNRAFIIVMIINIVINVVFFLICRGIGSEAAGKSMKFGALFFIFSLSGVFQGAMFGFPSLLLPSVIEYGHWLTGKLQTGLIYSISALGISLGGAVGGKVTAIILNWSNFVPNAIQTVDAKNGIFFGTFMIPVIIVVGQVVLQLFFGLSDEKRMHCLAEIEAPEHLAKEVH